MTTAHQRLQVMVMVGIVVSLLSVGCRSLMTFLRIPEPVPGVPQGAVRLSGDLVEAAAVAMNDLLARRREDRDRADGGLSSMDDGAASFDAGPSAESAPLDGGAAPVSAELPAPPAQPTSNTGDWRAAFRECFARPESYDTYVAWTEDRYIVRIVPVAERCFGREASLFGGGARYELGSDFAILKRDYDE